MSDKEKNMKRPMFKCIAAIFIAVVLGVFAVGPVFSSPQGEGGAVAADARLQEVGFHATGYPVVDKKITVEAVTLKSINFPVPFDTIATIAQIQEKSNIDLVFTEIPREQGAEKINLMFASREYPDVLFWGPNDDNIWDAAQGGDLWPLGDMIEKYAPHWQKAFQERPIIKKALTLPDGNIYSLPYYMEMISDYGVRDVTAINVDWLQKVGKEVPTTTDELYDALLAVKMGIDNGTLPKNAVPWRMLYHRWGNGGEWEIYNMFGLWMKGQGRGADKYLSVNNGKVEFGAIDPKLKDAAKYMHKHYAAGIVTDEAFTMKFGEWVTLTQSVPPTTAMFNQYFIVEPILKWFDFLPVLEGPTGVKRYRSQPVRMAKNKFTLFKKFKYPEAMVRFIDPWAEDEFSIADNYGGPYKKNADGTMTVVGGDKEWRTLGAHGALPLYQSKRISDLLVFTGNQHNRDQAVRKHYAPYNWPQDRHFAYITYTEEELDELAVLNVEISDYVKSSIAKWIVEGGVDAEFDAYVKQLDKLGLQKAMKIFQAAYDRFHGK